MRVLGGHDFFDSALAYGRDETLVFARKKFDDAPILHNKDTPLSPLHNEGLRFSNGHSWRRWEVIEHKGVTHVFTTARVWFAGKRYGGFCHQNKPLNSSTPFHAEWYWDHEKFCTLLDSIGAETVKRSDWLHENEIHAGNLRDHFEHPGKESEVDWLIENKVSIAIWCHISGQKGGGWKFDTDGLAAMGFAKRLDPFTAFQELSMWIGGVLTHPGNPMIEINSEKVVLKKHGMDEWSFKTPPQPKR